MSRNGVRARGVASFLAGAATALAGARLLAPRRAVPGAIDPFGTEMGKGKSQGAPDPRSLAAGYETDDANARQLGRIMAIFAGSALSGIVLMAILLNVLHHRDAARDVGLTVLQRAQVTPPLPHLQADPIGELGALQANQNQLLQGYATLDADTARIPIARAMVLVTGQSLDAHAAPDKPTRERAP